MSQSFPARLHALLAREAPVGVVFRRGPSKEVCSVLWDRTTDAFTLGQWLKGRIYERRCDISPDGRFLIYFAMNGRWQSETKGSWTAVSRAPWLKAVSLYAKGDCWEGGGLFLDNNRYWLNDRYFMPDKIVRESRDVTREERWTPVQVFGAEDTGVYYPRLQRDGWTIADRIENGKWDAATIFEKPLGSSDWILRKIAHEQVGAPPGKGCYWDEHELVRPGREELMFPRWEWADVDHEQLVWAEDGCLFRAAVSGDEPLENRKLLQDFNGYQFTSVEAPY